jgi:uridine phosphorylase
MTGSDDIPLLWDTTGAPSAFDPDDWFAYCEAVNGRERPTLPPFAIQTVIPAHFDLVLRRYGAEADDFTLAEHPFALFEHDGIPMAIGRSAKGSYAAGGLDEMIALGARHIVFLGGAGSLSSELEVGEFFVPLKALRDEGVSLHYLPPSRYAYPSERLNEAVLSACRRAGQPVKSGAMWTITAHFRQALPRLRAFRDEGCLAVNNEAAPAFAVGQARGVEVAALLNIGDTLADGRFCVPARQSRLYSGEDAAAQLDLAISALCAFAKGAAQ